MDEETGEQAPIFVEGTPTGSETQTVVVNSDDATIGLGTGSVNIVVESGGAIIESLPTTQEVSGDKIITAVEIEDPPAISQDTELAPEPGAPEGTPAPTISQVTGGLADDVEINNYVHTGAGNDTITYSGNNDLIRAGGGDDTVVAGGGADLVRGGSGSDQVSLGEGEDTLYFTTDQVVTGDADTITDFTAGEDQIAFLASDIQSPVGGLGTDTLVITNTAGETITLTATNGHIWSEDDIQFVV
ncbi:calcium-binding protein [Synechococcus sp. RSCCF101]|uniref:calcium-binding protein n=1 Tax=Synechococcus sp. RSCCF101 TaxID=2511069 RepID=UPI0012476223|nr:hypothetical protein [Synechococcus sp. RSCCF101]